VIGGSHTNTPSLTHEQATAQERGSVRGRKHQDCTRYCSRSSVIKEKEKRKTKLSYILKFTKNCQIPHRKLGPSRKRHWLGGGNGEKFKPAAGWCFCFPPSVDFFWPLSSTRCTAPVQKSLVRFLIWASLPKIRVSPSYFVTRFCDIALFITFKPYCQSGNTGS